MEAAASRSIGSVVAMGGRLAVVVVTVDVDEAGCAVLTCSSMLLSPVRARETRRSPGVSSRVMLLLVVVLVVMLAIGRDGSDGTTGRVPTEKEDDDDGDGDEDETAAAAVVSG